MNYLRIITLVVISSVTAFSWAQQKPNQAATQSSGAPKVDISRLVFHNCKGECEAKRVSKTLAPFAMPTSKDGMRNPIGANVCEEQFKAKVAFIKLVNKERGVCEFSDGSSVELHGLHLESEKFLKP